ncbi:hypothetical protein [Streptomyces sp. NPDC046197]|uniref:hypothetical protein n=1 Tax=Streptomyces sp. NPDC046197 TaxID=3154337 RepID=UPI0033E8A207
MTRRAVRRVTVAVCAAAVVGLGTASPATVSAAPNAPQQKAASLAQAPQGQPFLFSYNFNQHLKLGGGNFTVGGRVYVAVMYNNGRVAFARNVIAHTHPITPGGAVYVETNIAAPCAPGSNAYARAYDWTTQRWSPKLPVTVCVRFD